MTGPAEAGRNRFGRGWQRTDRSVCDLIQHFFGHSGHSTNRAIGPGNASRNWTAGGSVAFWRTDWPRLAFEEVTQSIVELAGEFADNFALRGYDSVQLAAARILQKSASEEVQFACFDTRLVKAARILGMSDIG